MPRVRKYHNGGKGPGHPHSKAQTPSDSKEFIEEYFKSLKIDQNSDYPGSYSDTQREYLTGYKGSDWSTMYGEKNLSAQESREMIESLVDYIKNRSVSRNVKSRKVALDHYNYLLSLSDEDLPKSYRSGAELAPAFFDTSMMDKVPLLGPPKNNQPLKQLMKSNASVPTSKRNTELMYKLNANMRTGQEPDKYKVWDEKGKKWSMRDVEPEELEYYRNKNKIQERQNIKASFNHGGRVRKYQDGGDVNDLLKMLNAFGSADPKDKEVLSSLVSESTQPSGYTAPVLPEEKKIDLIPKPNYGFDRELSGSERASMEMYGFPGGGSNVTSDWRTTLASLVPAVAAAPGGLGLIGSGFNTLYTPMTWAIPGLKGLTGHHVLSAMGLNHMITETPEAIGEFIENPSPGQALHVTWDALMGVPAISMLRKGIPASIKAFQEAKTLARFKRGAAGEGTFLWDDTAKDWRKMTQAEQEWFNLAEEANPKLISSITEPAASQDPLQQLAGKKPKVKNKKYEPVNAYEESNVAQTTSTSSIPFSKEVSQLYGGSDKTGMKTLNKQIDFIKNNIVSLEKGISEAHYDTWGDRAADINNYTSQLNNFKNALKRAKDIQSELGFGVDNTGVYQYPSFMTGSKLEKQVSPKDGTIARSALEQLVKNKNTRTSEATAVKDVLGEFEGKRIPYENFKQSLALDIRSADIIPTNVYSNVGIPELSEYRKWKYNITTKTNLYKDASLGLTKEGESHFPDTPHSFWIRSFPYENSLRILEWQTDVGKLKIPSNVLPGSKEAADYYPEQISGSVFDGDPDVMLSVDKQIKIFKHQIKNLKRDYKGNELGYEDTLAKMEKGLKIALDHRKQAMKTPSFKEVEAAAEGLSLKFLNESLLDAARQGKKYLDVPTAETVFTIEGWTKPNDVKLDPLYEEQSDIVKLYDTNFPRISSYSLDGTNERIQAINNVESRVGVEALIKNTIKEKEVIYDLLINSIEKNNPVAIGVFYKLNKGADFEDMYLDLKQAMAVEYDSGIKPLTFSKKVNDLKKNYLIEIKKIKSLDAKKAQENIIKYKASQKKIDNIKSRPFDIKDIGGENPTDEQKKKMAEFYSLTEDYRNTPKLFKSTFGTDAIPFTDEFGNTYNRVVVPEKFFQTDPSKPLEIKTYKKGGLLNKLVKKYQDGGGIFKKLRQRRADRRIEKTPVRDASSQEVLEMLASYGADSPMMQGEYDPREKEIVMYKDDPDTLKHEQVHATQYGPLQRLAKRMNDERSARIQDPSKRKAYRELTSGRNMVDDRSFNPAGQYVLGKGEEFEAVLDTGVNAAKEKGVNFNASFEEILSQLKNIPSPTNNMRGLMKFMSNKFTKEQRDLILKSIR